MWWLHVGEGAGSSLSHLEKQVPWQRQPEEVKERSEKHPKTPPSHLPVPGLAWAPCIPPCFVHARFLLHGGSELRQFWPPNGQLKWANQRVSKQTPRSPSDVVKANTPQVCRGRDRGMYSGEIRSSSGRGKKFLQGWGPLQLEVENTELEPGTEVQ